MVRYVSMVRRTRISELRRALSGQTQAFTPFPEKRDTEIEMKDGGPHRHSTDRREGKDKTHVFKGRLFIHFYMNFVPEKKKKNFKKSSSQVRVSCSKGISPLQ